MSGSAAGLENERGGRGGGRCSGVTRRDLKSCVKDTMSPHTACLCRVHSVSGILKHNPSGLEKAKKRRDENQSSKRKE